MRIPVPKNRLVAFTLAGALLTAVVAGALAVPIPGVTAPAGGGDDVGAATGGQQVAADAPTPNQDFTPAVQTGSGYEEEHEGYEGDEEDEHEDEEHEAD